VQAVYGSPLFAVVHVHYINNLFLYCACLPLVGLWRNSFPSARYSLILINIDFYSLNCMGALCVPKAPSLICSHLFHEHVHMDLVHTHRACPTEHTRGLSKRFVRLHGSEVPACSAAMSTHGCLLRKGLRFGQLGSVSSVITAWLGVISHQLGLVSSVITPTRLHTSLYPCLHPFFAPLPFVPGPHCSPTLPPNGEPHFTCSWTAALHHFHQKHTHTHTHTHTHMHTHTCTRTHTHAHAHAHTHTHTHTHTRIHIYIHAHAHTIHTHAGHSAFGRGLHHLWSPARPCGRCS